MENVVHVNGIRLAYRESGDPVGPPMVLLHGTGSRSGTWDGFAARMAEAGHRVLAVDLRGHAGSARSRDYTLDALRDDLLGLLAHLDLHDTVVVGHSVGAHAALAAATHAPHRITRLILEDLAAPPRPNTPAGPLSHTPAGPDRQPRPSAGSGLLSRAGSLLRLLPDAAAILWTRRDYHLAAMVSIFRQLARPDAAWWAALPGVRQPTLILSGGPTSCIPPSRLADVTAALPDARLATIPVGHRVHSLAPDDFLTEVTAFLTTSLPALR